MVEVDDDRDDLDLLEVTVDVRLLLRTVLGGGSSASRETIDSSSLEA